MEIRSIPTNFGRHLNMDCHWQRMLGPGRRRVIRFGWAWFDTSITTSSFTGQRHLGECMVSDLISAAKHQPQAGATPTSSTNHELSSRERRRLRYSGWNYTFVTIFTGAFGLFPLLLMMVGGEFVPDVFFANSVSLLLLSLMFSMIAYSKFHPGRNVETVNMVFYMAAGGVLVNFLYEQLM